MTSDSALFRSREELEADGWKLCGNIFRKGTREMLPLYEAKMLGMYDHRAADVVKSKTAEKRQNQPSYLTNEEHADPKRQPIPQAWVDEKALPAELPDWLVGFSDVTSPTNERTMISAALPRAGVGHTYPLYFTSDSLDRCLLLAAFNSFCFDFIARQKVSGLHMTYTYLRQIPVPERETLLRTAPWNANILISDWVLRRVGLLSCTDEAMRPLAEDLGIDYQKNVWDCQQRANLIAELDAAYFHLYRIEREAVAYIMDTFNTVKRKDIAEHGEYRTKKLILEIYDAMADAERSGVPYKSRFDAE